LIGTYIVDLIMKKNAVDNGNIRVICMDINEAEMKARFSEYFDKKEFSYYIHNVINPIPEDFPKVDYIIHAASNTSPLDYANYPVETFSANSIGTYYLLEYAKRTSIKRFLFCSSVEIYGQNRGDVERFTEDYSGYIDCNTPRAAYPTSKRACEAMCASYKKEFGIDYVIARIGRFYGPTVISGDTKAPTQFIVNALRGEDIVLKSDGTQLFSWGYVGDCATGILHMMVYGGSGEVYNIADSNSEVMLKDFAAGAANCAGTKLVFVEQNSVESAGYSKVTKALLDVSKLEKLGWKAKYNTTVGIKKTIGYLKTII
jgi:nucleoside-diphosphate-sugar epimerase